MSEKDLPRTSWEVLLLLFVFELFLVTHFFGYMIEIYQRMKEVEA